MQYVQSQVIGMDEEILIMFACQLAKVPYLLVGNPGTGKSHVSKTIANLYGKRDEAWFYQSITAKTSPEKIFGGIVAEEMLKGIETYNLAVGASAYKLNIFDEIFKSQHPALLGSLLSYFDENPTIFSGGQNKTPHWESVICTTNFEDLPDDAKTNPLWDRMVGRIIINNLSAEESKKALLSHMTKKNSKSQPAALSFEELAAAREEASKIKVPEAFLNLLFFASKDGKLPSVVEKVESLECYLSQRKINLLFGGKSGCPSVFQAIAYLLEEDKVSRTQLEYLPYFLWLEVKQFETLREALEVYTANNAETVYLTIMKALKQLRDNANIISEYTDELQLKFDELVQSMDSAIQEMQKDGTIQDVDVNTRNQAKSIYTQLKTRIKFLQSQQTETEIPF